MDFEELCNQITDSKGNYYVQEVLKDKALDSSERINIMNKISSKIVELSCHKKGTH